jgi:hypothetical protein
MNRTLATAILMAMLVAVASGCSAGSNVQGAPVVTSTPAPASTATSASTTVAPTTEPTSKPGTKTDEARGVAYLRSPERISRFQAIWPSGTVVAKALLAGKLGPLKKYNDEKKELLPNYIGWGGMQTLDKSSYAWVYWAGDGNADLSKGVRGFSIMGVQIEENPESVNYDFDGPYQIFIDRGTYTLTNGTLYLGGISPQSPFRDPTTLSELMDRDNIALDTLARNLKNSGLS